MASPPMILSTLLKLNTCAVPSEKISIGFHFIHINTDKGLSSKLDYYQFHIRLIGLSGLQGMLTIHLCPSFLIMHGFQLPHQKVLASSLNQISSILPSYGSLFRHFMMLAIFPLPGFNHGSPGQPHDANERKCCTLS